MVIKPGYPAELPGEITKNLDAPSPTPGDSMLADQELAHETVFKYTSQVCSYSSLTFMSCIKAKVLGGS